jgi:hypothetical protein
MLSNTICNFKVRKNKAMSNTVKSDYDQWEKSVQKFKSSNDPIEIIESAIEDFNPSKFDHHIIEQSQFVNVIGQLIYDRNGQLIIVKTIPKIKISSSSIFTYPNNSFISASYKLLKESELPIANDKLSIIRNDIYDNHIPKDSRVILFHGPICKDKNTFHFWLETIDEKLFSEDFEELKRNFYSSFFENIKFKVVELARNLSTSEVIKLIRRIKELRYYCRELEEKNLQNMEVWKSCKKNLRSIYFEIPPPCIPRRKSFNLSASKHKSALEYIYNKLILLPTDSRGISNFFIDSELTSKEVFVSIMVAKDLETIRKDYPDYAVHWSQHPDILRYFLQLLSQKFSTSYSGLARMIYCTNTFRDTSGFPIDLSGKQNKGDTSLKLDKNLTNYLNQTFENAIT